MLQAHNFPETNSIMGLCDTIVMFQNSLISKHFKMAAVETVYTTFITLKIKFYNHCKRQKMI